MSTPATKKRLPLAEWFALQTPERQRQYLERQEAKRKAGTTKKTTKRAAKKYVAKKGYTRGGSRGGTNIIYPNIVGRGPYAIGGNIGWGNENSMFRGNVGGKLYSNGYDSGTVQGLGGYTIKRNSLISSVDLGLDPPQVRNTNLGEATVINHREYLGDLKSGALVDGSTAFALESFVLNPGNSDLFPFLSKIAAQYTEYEIRGMLFELKSLSSEYAAQVALGSMFMGCDYNVLGPAPTTKQQLENMEYSSSAKPSKSMIMPIECDPGNTTDTHRYVSIDGEYNGGDARLSDWGKVYIGSQGLPAANQTIAEIWITYEVAFFKQIISQNDPPTPLEHWNGAHFHLVGITNNWSCGPPGTTVPATWNDPAYTFVNNQSAQLHFPIYAEERHYFVSYSYYTTADAQIVAPFIGPGGRASLSQCWASDAGANAIEYSRGPNVVAGRQMCVNLVVQVDGGLDPAYDAFIQIPNGYPTSSAGSTWGDLVVLACPPESKWGNGDTSLITKEQELEEKLRLLEERIASLSFSPTPMEPESDSEYETLQVKIRK